MEDPSSSPPLPFSAAAAAADTDDDDDDPDDIGPADYRRSLSPVVVVADDDNDANKNINELLDGGGSTAAAHNDNEEEVTSRDDDDDDDDADTETLRQVAARACKRIDIGTAILPQPLFAPDVEDYQGDDVLQDAVQSLPSTHYARVLASEFNAVVIEHHLKWAPLCIAEPGPLPNQVASDRLGRYDFYEVDRMVDWALQRDMKVKGHVLVWAVTSPQALLERLPPDQVRAMTRQHIFTTMGHFSGRIQVWDVVNEALAPDGTLAHNVFYRKLGPHYIADCFRWAHEADPTATLLYNDNKVEGYGTVKAQAFYDLLRNLTAQGVPVHGCGLQGHFNAAGVGPKQRCPTPSQVRQQIHRLGELGLSVNISEMDVRVSQLPATTVDDNSRRRQRAQEQIYHDILAAALSEPCFDGVWLWGFTDRHTWVTHFYYDDEPCILDEDYGRKPAYYAVRNALATLTPGGVVGGHGVLLHDDVDVHGQAWGHAWRMPEPENNEGTDHADGTAAHNARPDWEQPPGEESNAATAEPRSDADTAVVTNGGTAVAATASSQAAKNLPPIS